MRSLLTVARELAQCAHGVGRFFPVRIAAAGVAGVTTAIDICMVCGAWREYEGGVAQEWKRAQLVDELDPIVRFERLLRVWRAGERCIAAQPIVYAMAAVEIVERSSVLLVRWDGDDHTLATSPDSVDPYPPEASHA